MNKSKDHLNYLQIQEHFKKIQFCDIDCECFGLFETTKILREHKKIWKNLHF